MSINHPGNIDCSSDEAQELENSLKCGTIFSLLTEDALANVSRTGRLRLVLACGGFGLGGKWASTKMYV